MASTTFGDQVINTIDNLNMKGKFKEDSLRQFENLNTAVIKYTDNLRLADEGSKLELYDSISESIIEFELVVLPPDTLQNQFLRDNNSADNTAQNLTDRINDITLQGTANNHYSAIIEYFDTLNTATPNDTITLYNYQTAVVFTMVTTISTPPQATAVEFEEGGDADATATNLCNAINNHSSFSAIIDITKNIIIITQISSSGKPTNNEQNGFLPDSELSVTNFSNFSATIDKSNTTITVIQNSSKSYKDNSISGFENSNDNTIALNVQNFRVNSDDEAAIPSETIGTYQIIDKIITDLSLLKKKITSRNKILQNDLSDDHAGDVNLTEPASDTSNKVATYISNIPIGNPIGDKDRGNLDDAASKPSIFESDTIKYSEDALFRLLKGLFYEILKFKNGITDGENNGGTSGGAGKQSIPIAISALTSNNTGTAASLTNVIATIENINKSDGTFYLFANTSNTSIPSENNGTIKFVGLLQLINEFIKNLVEIKNQIKINESEFLTALNANNSDPDITVSNVDSKITILKVRNGFTENTSTDNSHKPSIFTSDKKYSEDAVFGLFSCISYELMKLLNGTDASNNNSIIGFAGLQAIPVSIEDV